MAILLLAGFMNLIDVTIVNVALPSMQSGLAATSSGIEWVVAAYICAFAIGLLPFGRLGDMLGRRNVFLAGIACFSIASALCGMAPTIETLVPARVLQGVSGAMMTPQTLAIAQVIFPIHERAMAFSLFGLTAGLASVAGPLVGGLLIEADLFGLGWRPIFLVNVPVGIFAIIAGLRFIPSMAGNRAIGIDRVGIAIAAATLLLVIFPLVEGRNFDWPLWCFLLMLLSVPMAYGFVRWQGRQARRGRPQLLPVSLLSNRQFLGGTVLVALFFSGVPGFFMVLAVFLQSGFGLDPLHSGLTTMPFPAGVLLASLVSGRLGARFPRQRIFLGSLMLVIGLLWLKALAATIGNAFHSTDFLPPLALAGLGLGTAVSPLFQSVLSSVQGRDAGSASGGVQSFQQVGAALGVAVMGQIFFSRLPQGAGDPHPAFVQALEAAMIYGCITFALVGVFGLLIKPPRHSGEPSGGPAFEAS
ncbi:EmrB/QacA subfamily drug resistance transporter [Hoeflea marina]|uniref:EmrB/QacA subfamily drug resistance transporter n=2 Tax=Hoeflea marina TaxID=274592 RepID=A0A317PN12_9HYPH|nr:EmrB/QacA subfamily drug resistance transporter [Hoeflea marina]